MSGEDVKPEKWSITVSIEGHEQLKMLVMPTTKMEKVIKAFTSRHGLRPELIRFFMDDLRIDKDKTVEENGLEDGDTIEGRIEQQGGAL